VPNFTFIEATCRLCGAKNPFFGPLSKKYRHGCTLRRPAGNKKRISYSIIQKVITLSSKSPKCRLLQQYYHFFYWNRYQLICSVLEVSFWTPTTVVKLPWKFSTLIFDVLLPFSGVSWPRVPATSVTYIIKFGADIFIQSGVIDIFPKLKMTAAAILDFQIMWIWPFVCVDNVVMCSVPNWVKMSALVTEIDALMLQTFIWWRHAN